MTGGTPAAAAEARLPREGEAVLRRVASGRASGFLLIAALLVLWQISAQHWVKSENWPPLTAVWQAFLDGIRSGELPEVFGSSLYRMGIGYGIGAAAAV